MPPITFLSAAVPDSCTFNPFCEKAIALLGALQPAQKCCGVQTLVSHLYRITAVSLSSYVTKAVQQEKKNLFKCFLWTKGDKDLIQFYCLLDDIQIPIQWLFLTSAQLIQLFICSQFGYMHLDLFYFNMDSYCLNLWANFSLFLKNLFTVI